jgi:hypothetical protein
MERVGVVSFIAFPTRAQVFDQSIQLHRFATEDKEK